MSRKPFNLAELIRTRFADADRETLDKAYELKKGHRSPDVSDDDLRTRLVELFPHEAEEHTTMAPPASAERAVSQRAAGSKIPNLRSTGRWEGRMRRVIIHKSDEQSKSDAYTVGWDGQLWKILYEQPVDMPWPYWMALQETYFVDDRSDAVTKWERNENGQLYAVRTPRKIRTVRWTDLGDVPGTEDLPIDYKDFFTREAKRTSCFARYPRAALMMIHNILREPRGPKYNEEAFNAAFFRDMQDVDIRIRIAEALGPDIEAMMTDSVYEAAEA